MKCLIVDYMYDNIEELLIMAGLEPDYRPTISRDEIVNIIHDYEGLIIRSKTRVDEALVEQAKQLKFVGRAGAGIDNLDEEVLDRRGIKILNAPEGNRNALGEHCIGLLLGLLNNIVKSDMEVRQGIWDREGNRGYELSGKTVGLVGCGYMGTAFAEKLRGFDCEVLVFDKYKDNCTNSYMRQTSMEEIYERADVFSLHIPLTTETKGLVDFDYINKFRKKIFFLNTSRGEIVSLSGLCKAIESGKVIGAGLDVLENEKINNLTTDEQKVFDYLVNSRKTILTPHIGGWSYESYEKINNVLVDKIKKEINGIQ
ncbi:phosphoglycerate dehydrogenase [Fulvivirga sp. 29W222]|uniref:Phosphoglycerate dehydrogenase n=1 Tax=Fulvivirga marina TaxID=2494733 RepID=A0A937G2A0_9BACT|nr:NAD(P)-dependent oxidoreductase [Fulvivirga marina]MBL6448665.1 phosphoglycerate dehydrogenase [Fulvivirga marina]